MRTTPKLTAILAALLLAACSDSSSDQVHKLQGEVRELSQQLRQYRSEIQRSNEKIVAMLQASGLQSDNPPPAITSLAPGSAALAPRNMAASKQILAANQRMADRMGAEPLTGDPDRDFITQMIPHHEGAVDMSRVLLQSGTRPEIKRFALEIIAHQQAEIDMMKRWLEQLKR